MDNSADILYLFMAENGSQQMHFLHLFEYHFIKNTVPAYL